LAVSADLQEQPSERYRRPQPARIPDGNSHLALALRYLLFIWQLPRLTQRWAAGASGIVDLAVGWQTVATCRAACWYDGYGLPGGTAARPTFRSWVRNEHTRTVHLSASLAGDRGWRLPTYGSEYEPPAVDAPMQSPQCSVPPGKSDLSTCGPDSGWTQPVANPIYDTTEYGVPEAADDGIFFGRGITSGSRCTNLRWTRET
jgi:hypothetical protein